MRRRETVLVVRRVYDIDTVFVDEISLDFGALALADGCIENLQTFWRCHNNLRFRRFQDPCQLTRCQSRISHGYSQA